MGISMNKCMLDHDLTGASSGVPNGGTTCSICTQHKSPTLLHSCDSCNFHACTQCARLADSFLEHPGHYEHGELILTEPSALAALGKKCSSCKERLQLSHDTAGFVYACKVCDFEVHGLCARLPRKRLHRVHHHDLTLRYGDAGYEHRNCNHCGQTVGDGAWVYLCDRVECVGDVTLCLPCSWLPNGPLSSKHPHRLLIVKPGNNGRTSWVCDVCHKVSGLSDGVLPFRYRCESCDFDAHFACILPKGGSIVASVNTRTKLLVREEEQKREQRLKEEEQKREQRLKEEEQKREQRLKEEELKREQRALEDARKELELIKMMLERLKEEEQKREQRAMEDARRKQELMKMKLEQEQREMKLEQERRMLELEREFAAMQMARRKRSGWGWTILKALNAEASVINGNLDRVGTDIVKSMGNFV